MKPAIDYINALPIAQKKLCLHWHCLVTELPGISSPIKYGIPFYYQKKWICYLNPQKDGKRVELVFLNAKSLSNDSGLLEFNGRKMVAGYMLQQDKEIPWQELLNLFHEAILLQDQQKLA